MTVETDPKDGLADNCANDGTMIKPRSALEQAWIRSYLESQSELIDPWICKGFACFSTLIITTVFL